MEGLASEERKRFLEGDLSRGERLDHLKIAIGYPINYNPDWDSHSIDPATTTPVKDREDYSTWFSNIDKEFQRRKAEFQDRTDPDFRPYWDLADELVEKYKDLTKTKDKERTLFVSCHYEVSQVKAIAKYASRYGFTVVTGENLLKDPSLARGLIKKIRSSTHFLGVWSSDGAQRLQDSWWPSPWLLWEFGVAEACGLTWRLLIQNDIDSTVWQKVASHQQNQRFTTVDFVEKLKEILSVLAELPPKENL